MGLGTESGLLIQAKKAQGETNERLDRIADLLETQIALLKQLVPERSTR